MTKVVALIFLGPVVSWACSCFPINDSKTYQGREKKWYGEVVSYSCQYVCKSNSAESRLVGYHVKRLLGKERGNEIICDGTVYKEQYSMAAQWFIFVYDRSQWFSPKKSNSKNLRLWAEQNCSN